MKLNRIAALCALVFAPQALTINPKPIDHGLDIAPAYAEVSCEHGLYSGFRYRFRLDPVVHLAILYEGKARDTALSLRDISCLYT
jgi:hypothetical protein